MHGGTDAALYEMNSVTRSKEDIQNYLSCRNTSSVSNRASSAFRCCSLARVNVALCCLTVSRRLRISYLTKAYVVRIERSSNEKSYVGLILQQPSGDLSSAPLVALDAPKLRVSSVIKFRFEFRSQETMRKMKMCKTYDIPRWRLCHPRGSCPPHVQLHAAKFRCLVYMIAM